MAEAQQQIHERQDHLEDKQTTAAKQLRKHDSEIQEIETAMKKTTTTTTDYMKDMERRIQGLENNATTLARSQTEETSWSFEASPGTQHEATSWTSFRAC